MTVESRNTLFERKHFIRLNHRRRTEAIAELARASTAKLTDAERALLKLILEHHSAYAAIAAATGLSKSTICRRYQRILKKLRSAPLPQPGPERIDRIIRRMYADGAMSQMKIAAKLNVSRYYVRQSLLRTRHETQ